MPRTVVKCLQQREGKTLGQAIPELLADALARRREGAAPAPTLAWTTKDMAARVDVDDKDALLRALGEAGGDGPA